MLPFFVKYFHFKFFEAGFVAICLMDYILDGSCYGWLDRQASKWMFLSILSRSYKSVHQEQFVEICKRVNECSMWYANIVREEMELKPDIYYLERIAINLVITR
jgi:hypothetical protein